MPVSRENREVVANALAAFLRGEMSEDAFRNRLNSIWVGLDQNAVQDDYLSHLCGLLLTKTLVDLSALSEPAWRQLVRDLAFLKSDLEPTRPASPPADDPDFSAQVRMARWHVLGLAVSFGLGLVVGWWLPAVCCVVSFVSYATWEWRQDKARDKERFKQWAKELAFAPFECEEDWLAHKRLLEPSHLPEYDPAIHWRPRTFSLAKKFWGAGASYLIMAGLALILAFMYAFSVLIWPLSLVLMSLCPASADRGSEAPGQ